MPMSNSAPVSSRAVPRIDILFLGSPGVGKATFLSRLPSVQHPSVANNPTQVSPLQPNSGSENLSSPSTTTLPPPPSADIPPPAYTASPPPQPAAAISIPTPRAHPLTCAVTFNVSLFARPYNISIHPSTSPLFIDDFPTDPPPRFAIIAFSIPDKVSLYNARHYWMAQLRQHYPDEEGMRVMLVGLKRDLRTDRKIGRRNWEGRNGSDIGERRVCRSEVEAVVQEKPKSGRVVGRGAREVINASSYYSGLMSDDGDEEWEYECVMPEEGLQAAREMHADRYAECSALTGELMWEVVEDITRTAAMTTVEEGRENSGNCVMM